MVCSILESKCEQNERCAKSSKMEFGLIVFRFAYFDVDECEFGLCKFASGSQE